MDTKEGLYDLDVMLKRVRRNTLGDILSRTRDRVPNKFAIAYKDTRLTYAELDDLVNQTAQVFKTSGMEKGDMIAIMSKNSLDFVVCEFALAGIGAVLVPINYMLNKTDVAYILNHAKVAGVISSVECTEILDKATEGLTIRFRYLMDVSKGEQLNHLSSSWVSLTEAREGQPTQFVDVELDDDDLAQVLYTSGTESRPKGVMLTHKSIVSEYVSCIISGGMSEEDICIHALPLYHCAQLHCFLGPSIYFGSSGIILEGAKPDMILETIEKEKVTQLFCPPTVWISLLRHPDFDKRELSTLQKCYYGAAIMPKEILKELKERLPKAKFWNFYGQTEIAPLGTILQPEEQLRKLGSAGKPSLNVQTIIVDDLCQEVPRGEIGEIVHRTPHAMKGYLHDPQKTHEAFMGGWFHSGDLGYMDEEGYITVVDRKKDMIKTGGVNVSSREVEEAIYQIKGVSEVAVIGIPDSYWIEAVTAIIVPKVGFSLTKEEVLTFCQKNLSKFKQPKYIEFTNELPKNPSGKVLKKDLRQIYKELAEN